jgi:methionyl aminopeptidase
VYIDEDNGWTAITKDGSLSAQWEHTVLVSEDGIEIISR